MIVPQYWAEARVQQREGGRQVTVRHFGWSDRSREEAQAQAQAEARAREAFARIWAGEKLPRLERKVAYNGADGMPIREEIIDTVITRNGYGARCLNTPNVLFADIDDDYPRSGNGIGLVAVLLGLAGCVTGWLLWGMTAGIVLFFAGALIPILIANRMEARKSKSGSPRMKARLRVEGFVERHPDWRLRLYETPACLRALAKHRTFDPTDPEVEAFFRAVKADPVYV